MDDIEQGTAEIKKSLMRTLLIRLETEYAWQLIYGCRGFKRFRKIGTYSTWICHVHLITGTTYFAKEQRRKQC